MIEINLLPGKKKKAPGAGMKLSMPDFKGIIAQVKDPWLLGAIAAWVVVGGGGALLFITDRARLAAAETRLENVRVEKRRYDIVIAQKRQAEKVRDSLLYEITVIRQIDADRYIWPHVLDQATKALPPYTWITEVRTASSIVAPGAGQPNNGPVTVDRDSSGAPSVAIPATACRVAVVHRRDARQLTDRDRSGSSRDVVYRDGALPHCGFGLHPHHPARAIGEVGGLWHSVCRPTNGAN